MSHRVSSISPDANPDTPPPGEGVEIVTAGNVLIAAVRPEIVRQQSLIHRSVALLLYDHDRRLCLVKRAAGSGSYAGRWDVSGFTALCHGRSVLETGRRLALDIMPLCHPARLAILETELPPMPMTDYAFTSLVQASFLFKEGGAPPPAREVMFTDREELAFLLEDYRSMFTPLVTQCWEQHLLFTPEDA